MATSRVVVGMSGGVDSSVTALLLKEQGYEVVGLFMKNWDETDENGVCSAEQDYADVEKVCDHLGIQYSSVSFSKQYAERVFAQFVQDYERGLTPNPDVLCNREIKFDVFAEQARALGADWIATGHYARLRNGRLLKGLDPGKDQSYFLHAVAPQAFQNVLFPVGELQKSQVREIALRAGLPTAAKKDSTGICFIGERKFREFLSRYVPAKSGLIREWNAKDPLGRGGLVVGEHRGVAFFTLGQRKGLMIGGSDQPYFVVDKDPQTNTLIVAKGQDHPALYTQSVRVDRMHWLVPPSALPQSDEILGAKLRYRQEDQFCLVELLADGGAKLHFKAPQRAATPGQFAVLYRGEQCLGGGVILSSRREFAAPTELSSVILEGQERHLDPRIG